eukprot:GEMP01001700.1.p1 GENE.GEMP01001700.1~~GEMP01001700.1.p1  ORF type:complete len:1312 (+),score=317.68 GEMP01001700.1:407-3937(+)
MVDQVVTNIWTWLQRCLAEPSVDHLWPQIIPAIGTLTQQLQIATAKKHPEIIRLISFAHQECAGRLLCVMDADRFLQTATPVDDVLDIGRCLDEAMPSELSNLQSLQRLEEELLQVGKEVVEGYVSRCEEALSRADTTDELGAHLHFLRDSVAYLVSSVQWASRSQRIVEFTGIFTALVSRSVTLVNQVFTLVVADGDDCVNDGDEILHWAAAIDAVNKAVETGEFKLDHTQFADISGAAPRRESSAPVQTSSSVQPEQTSSSECAAMRIAVGPFETQLRRKHADDSFPGVLSLAQEFVQTNQEFLQTDGMETKAIAEKLPKEQYLVSLGFQWEFSLGRGDFKDFSKEKSDEVEAAYQKWVAMGRPSDDNSRRVEIHILAEKHSQRQIGQRESTVGHSEEILSQSLPRIPTMEGASQLTAVAGNDNDHDGSVKRPPCQFGESCYRRNTRHRNEFAHRGDWDFPTEPQPLQGGSYSLDFVLMTQKNLTRRVRPRVIRRRQLPSEVQAICAPHYERVITFVAKAVHLLEQAEFLAAWLEDADKREAANKDIEIVVSNLRPPLKAFLQLAVMTQANEMLDTLDALLGEKANTLQIGAAVKHLKLTGTVTELKNAFVVTQRRGAYEHLNKWELIRGLVQSKLLNARLCRIAQDEGMRTLRQKHSLMKCQALLQEIPDIDFRVRFLLSATDVLSAALKQASEWVQTWRVVYLLKIAHTWDLKLDDSRVLGELLTKNLTSSLQSTLQGMNRITEILIFWSQCAAYNFEGLPSMEPFMSRIAVKFVREQAALWQINTTVDASMLHSVRQAIQLRGYVAPVEAFDKALFVQLQQRFQQDVRPSLVEWVIAYCESVKLDLPQWMLTKDQVECLQVLQEAEKSNDPKLVIKAVVFAKQIKGGIEIHERLQLEYSNALMKLKKLNRMPSGWDVERLAEDENKPMFLKTEMDSEVMLQVVQSLFNETYQRIITRDRTGGLSRRYLVQRIQAVQNVETWKDYLNRCDQIRDQCRQDSPSSAPISDAQWQSWSGNIMALRKHEQILEMFTLPALDPSINEFFFFHGTTPEAADKIAQCHFDMSYASKSGLFGAGIYFAESCSKSDEYVKPNKNNQFPILLVRVALGRMNYCAEKEPWKDPGRRALEDSCLSGGFHSVLGDRKRARNTYREFVIYDSAQCYPHLIVWYSRC